MNDSNINTTIKLNLITIVKHVMLAIFRNFRGFRGFDTSTLTHFGGLFLNTYGLKIFFPLLYI